MRLNFTDDDVATKRAFMVNWVGEIKWDWVGKSACEEGKVNAARVFSASAITYAGTETQINDEKGF